MPLEGWRVQTFYRYGLQGIQHDSRSAEDHPDSFDEAKSLLMQSFSVDCKLSEWSSWSRSWLDGVERRRKNVLIEAQNGGRACPDNKAEQQRSAPGLDAFS